MISIEILLITRKTKQNTQTTTKEPNNNKNPTLIIVTSGCVLGYGYVSQHNPSPLHGGYTTSSWCGGRFAVVSFSDSLGEAVLSISNLCKS